MAELKSMGKADLRDITCWYRGYSLLGRPPNQYTRPGPIVTTKCISQVGTSSEAILLKNSGKYRPGRIKLSPAMHYTYSCGCSPASLAKLYYVSDKPRVLIEIGGHLAAHAVYNGPNFPSFPADSAKQQQVLLTTAIADYKSATLDVGMMIAEAGDTIELLISPFTALPKLAKKLIKPRSLRRGQRSLGSNLKYAADAWLQYQFGIKPLLSDIDSIRGATRDILEPRHVDYACSRCIKSLGETHKRYPMNGVGSNCANLFGHYSRSVSHTVRAQAFYRVVSQHSGAQLGVDLSSLPNLIWEKIPFSFVVDWWLDVGTWLRAITPKPGITSLGACTSICSEDTFSCQVTGASISGISPTYPLTAVTSTMVSTSTVYSRSNATLPISYPRLRPGLASLNHKLDLAALSFAPINQIFQKILK